MHVTRRNLLRALGLGGSAYFLPSALGRSSSARAATATIPTRVLFFYTPHGTLLRQWVAPPAGATAMTETSFALGPVLTPLQPSFKKLNIVEGLDFRSEYVDPTAAKDGHYNGQTHALSAANRATPSAAGGASIDQFIAQQLNSPTPVTPLPSLELSARYDAGSANMAVSWSGSNALVPPMTDPAAVYTRMFPSGPPSQMPSSMDSAASAVTRRRKSVLDAVLGEFNAIKQPLSSNDKSKLDAHADLIRKLEAEQSLPVAAPGSCVAPANKTVASTPYAQDCRPKGPNCVNEAAAAFSTLATAAFSCDITRVITLDIDTFPDAMFSDNPNVAKAGGIHQFLHGMDDLFWFEKDRYGTNPSISATTKDPTNVATAVKFFAGYAQILQGLLQQLDAVPEPDGTTLLDHTIVVWCGELGTSNHLSFWVNYLLAGGGAAGIKTGRYLSIPRNQPLSSQEYFHNSGMPHNNLMVSLANLMGLSKVTSFGNSSVCTGPLTQLTA